METPLLQPQLDAQKEKMWTMFDTAARELLAVAAEELAASGLTDRALQVGEQAPDFILPGLDGKPVTLSGLLATGPVVLVFYRGSWCPYCNLQFKGLADALPRIEGAGGSLVGISPSTPDNSLTMAEKHQVRFRVLSDVGNRVSKAYRLVYTLDPRLRPLYENFGIDIPATNGDDSYELPIAATFVVGRDGIVARAFLDTDYTRRMEPSDIVATLEAMNGAAV